MPASRPPVPGSLLAAAILAAVPAAASGATLAIDDDVISVEECLGRASEEVDLSWDLAGASGSTVELLGSDASGCSESDATTAVLVDGLDPSRTYYPASGESTLTLAEVVAAAGKSPTCEGSDFRVYVCVRLLDDSGTEVTTASAAIRFQLQRPPPPVGLNVKVGERALYVSWTEGSATIEAPASSETYRAFASAGGATYASSETSGTSARIPGLQNGTTYDVRVVAYSESGNASEPSELAAGTPQPVMDFFDLYEDAGGREGGGCAQGGVPELLALVGAAWAARGRRASKEGR